MQRFRGGNARADRLVLPLLLALLTVLLIHQDWLWRLDRVIYDAQLRFWARPAPDNIVIISVDEESLSAIGRWPWPRSVHAKLLKSLSAEQPLAIGFDIILAEPDSLDPLSDAALADALENNRNVIMPIVIEQSRLGGQFIETLPLTSLTAAASGLGHVHIEIDRDGIARQVFLNEGLGSPHWETLALTLLRAGRPELANRLPVIGTSDYRAADAPHSWVRENPVLIPFAGPPGHFKRISYQQVLNGKYLPGTFDNKFVLIGATAAGLGDYLPTPLSGLNEPMSGVEINANILDALQQGILIRPVDLQWKLVFSAWFAILPFIFFQRFLPHTNMAITGVLMLMCLAASTAMLTIMHQWLPPTAALLALALSFPLWNSRRLENALKFLGTELKRLTEYDLIPQTPTQTSLEASLESLVNILGLRGWCISDPEGRPVAQHGECPSSVTVPALVGTWTRNGHHIQTALSDGEKQLLIAMQLQSDEPLAANELALLERLIQRYTAQKEPVSYSSSELVQTRIEQVQLATDRVRSMYQFIDDSIAQMADGILVTDEFGVVTLLNDKAQRFLGIEDLPSIRGQQATRALHSLGAHDPIDWNGYLKQVLLEKTPAQVNTRNQAGLDLMVQITPVSITPDSPAGVIIILSNISELKNSERRRIEAVSFLSHDLRSPMVSLLALVELARAKGVSQEQQELFNRMEDYSNRAIHLSEQFLQLARAESDDELVFSEINLADIINNAREEVWGMAQARKMRLEMETEIDEAWIHGNADLLERTITNLLTNAIKYSPENGVITITLHEEQQGYRCCVEDQGHGIPAEELPTLFNRFKRGSLWEHSSQSGAGLGLALVKATLQRHHGQVDVSSTPGKGSRFCIILPAADPTT